VQQVLTVGIAPSGLALVSRKLLISLATLACCRMQHGKAERDKSWTWRNCGQVLHKVTHRVGGKLRIGFEIMDLRRILEVIAKNTVQLPHA
jgi:hypothetical protein